MNLVQKIKHEILDAPQDERQQYIRQSASWKAIMALVVGYIIIGIIYAGLKEQIPWSTQVIFYLSFFTFAYVSMKHDGFSFAIPLIKETKETLDLPASVRSIPWLLVFGGSTMVIMNILITSIIMGSKSILVNLISGILGIALYWYAAKRLRKGSRFWVDFLIISSFIGILYNISDIIMYVLYSLGRTDIINIITIPDIINLIFCFWFFAVLVKHQNKIFALKK